MAMICEPFEAVADMAFALGVKDVGKRETPWVYCVDEHWTIAINGTKQKHKVEPADHMPVTIKPFEMAVWWCGWLAGILSPDGGILAAGGLANSDTFCAACRAVKGPAL